MEENREPSGFYDRDGVPICYGDIISCGDLIIVAERDSPTLCLMDGVAKVISGQREE